METTYENTHYFASLSADRYSKGDWYLLELWLASGEGVTVHHTIWCQLLETAQIRSASRAGIIVESGGMLVRLSIGGAFPPWLQALPVSPWVQRGHEHSITPVTLHDSWVVLRCVECGGEW